MFQSVLLLVVQLLVVSESFNHIPFQQRIPITDTIPPSDVPYSIVKNLPTVTPFPTHSPMLTIRPTENPLPSPTPTPTPQPTDIPTPSQKPTSQPTAIPVSSLLSSINNYRSEHGVGTLSSHATLCTIANERLTQLRQRGSLDNHEGFQKYVSQLSSEFRSWREVIFQSSSALSADMAVREGWANSPPHKESLLNTESVYGCGQTGNGFAVFILTSPK
jgi:uncharacterized protein YkwD